MDLYYTDSENQLKPVYMGSYGIGPARILASIVEQNHDEHGIIFPEIVSPYDLEIVIVDMKDEEQVRIGNELYDLFQSMGKDVLLDDRDERAGIKFKDSDLIGIPKRIVVGRGASSGMVEVKTRSTGEVVEVPISEIESIC
jgi:prolyl-tRNA synthetase